LKNFIKDYGQIITGFFIFLVSCFLAYIAYEQTEISQNVARITKNATRPYLVVENIELPVFYIDRRKTHFRPNEKFIVSFTIKNKGQTPAYEVIDSVRVAILDSNTVLPMPPTNWTNKYIVASEFERFKVSQHIFNEESRRKISASGNNQADHWLYFWGKITYADIAGRPYFVEFGYRFMFTHDRWLPYKEYNRAN